MQSIIKKFQHELNHGTKSSKMDQVKFFKDYFPQILLGPLETSFFPPCVKEWSKICEKIRYLEFIIRLIIYKPIFHQSQAFANIILTLRNYGSFEDKLQPPK